MAPLPSKLNARPAKDDDGDMWRHAIPASVVRALINMHELTKWGNGFAAQFRESLDLGIELGSEIELEF